MSELSDSNPSQALLWNPSAVMDHAPRSAAIASVTYVEGVLDAADRTTPLQQVTITDREGARQAAWGQMCPGDAFKRLTELCGPLVQGETYTIHDISSACGWQSFRVEAECRDVMESIPQALRVEIDSVGRRHITIGNIALSARLSEPSDSRIEGNLKFEHTKDVIDRDRPAILAHDHARITVDNPKRGEQHYYLPLERGNAVLAARVLSALEGTKSHVAHVKGEDIAHTVWSRMPTTERELFISNRERIIGPKSTHIKPHVLAVLRKLTGLISITRETTGEVFLLEGRPNITIHADAPANIAELHGFRPLFPPGTEIEKMKLSAYQHISAEALAHAKQLLEHQLGYKESLTHRQALTLLDLITDAEIKRALRQEIRRQDHSISSARALEMLRSQVKRSLDEGFYDAWRARMIGGNSATGSEGHVRLIGGMLPIITNPARFVTKRWNVGPVFKS